MFADFPTTMRIATVASLVVILSLGCSATTPPNEPEPNALTQKIEAAKRFKKDKKRDGGRKPGEVLTFLGIEPGMTVIDLIASAGYYTEVLSISVGPEGRVYCQNDPRVLKLDGGARERALSKRLAGRRLPNVKRIDRSLVSTGIPSGSVDLAITALNFHDIYNGRGPDVAAGFLLVVYRMLKPGGVLGIIDHIGEPNADNSDLHRIDPALVRATIEASPFTLEATSDVLRNPNDAHNNSVFNESMRGRTDRFVMLLRKPQ